MGDDIENDDDDLELDEEDGSQGNLDVGDDDDAGDDDETGDESDEDEGEEGEGDEDDDGKRKQAAKKGGNRSFQKRINKVTREKHDALREADRLRRENAELRKGQASNDAAANRPKQEDFEDYADYEQALESWAEEKGKAEAATEGEGEDGGITVEDIELADLMDNITLGATQPDFQDVIFSKDLNLTSDMLRAAGDSDIAADLLYYLGQNPKESLRISQLPKSAIPREMGRIEAMLEAGTATAKPRGKSKPSAPPPIKPGKTGGSKRSQPLNAKMSTEDWIRERQKQRAARNS